MIVALLVRVNALKKTMHDCLTQHACHRKQNDGL